MRKKVPEKGPFYITGKSYGAKTVSNLLDEGGFMFAASNFAAENEIKFDYTELS